VSHIKCCRFSISADIAVAILRVNVYWGFRKPYIEQAVGGKWDVTDLIGRTEKQAAIQSVTNMWFKKSCDEKKF
jgi:hypothetical protein